MDSTPRALRGDGTVLVVQDGGNEVRSERVQDLIFESDVGCVRTVACSGWMSMGTCCSLQRFPGSR
ncbi:hypothetical protein A5741_18790 [Mycolicibacterium conceptionense]|uniref:Uncharacterized protein n=1 Tax=Mycolicibacterium senegalense TaxID=1796 RepID=A0ABR5FMB3_9MYCO|nr:hypothetical protein AA982_04345 [Mycolicibacterium senegalense]KLO47681.1 hypothetical protein ABW05_31365 [Mycolicibacterium senegalense]OMB85335.1 hypothetical protein A5741_18790 [Mycolicibacterium conceptionense]